MTFLANLAGAVIGGLAGRGSGGVPSSVPSDVDYDRYLNQLERGTGTEIQREQQFLEQLAPAQAQAYNIYNDMTYYNDTERMQARMDRLFEGTSSWERLGNTQGTTNNMVPTSNASSSGKQALASLSSSAATVNAAKLQAKTQLNTSIINAAASMFNTQQQTKAPLQQAEVARKQLQINQQLANWKQIFEGGKLDLEEFKSLVPFIQKETFNLLFYKREGLMDGLGILRKLWARTGTDGKYSKLGDQLTDWARKVGPQKWEKFTEQLRDDISPLVLAGAGAAMGGKGVGFLSKLSKSRS